jgi:hypothetical protein
VQRVESAHYDAPIALVCRIAFPWNLFVSSSIAVDGAKEMRSVDCTQVDMVVQASYRGQRDERAYVSL